jgi:hypothetical protein
VYHSRSVAPQFSFQGADLRSRRAPRVVQTICFFLRKHPSCKGACAEIMRLLASMRLVPRQILRTGVSAPRRDGAMIGGGIIVARARSSARQRHVVSA